MKTLPKDFCVKANLEHGLWDEYISWLNRNPAEEVIFGYNPNGFFGLKNTQFAYYVYEWGEVITLEEWYGAVNAKSEFPEPVFITKSGVEIYDEVEMLVWDNDEAFAVPRRVIAKSMTDKWVFVNEHHNFLTAKNAKPIPEEVEVTLEEIAKWKGVDVKQIKIK